MLPTGLSIQNEPAMLRGISLLIRSVRVTPAATALDARNTAAAHERAILSLITDECCSAPPQPSRERTGFRHPATPSAAACPPPPDRASRRSAPGSSAPRWLSDVPRDSDRSSAPQ